MRCVEQGLWRAKACSTCPPQSRRWESCRRLELCSRHCALLSVPAAISPACANTAAQHTSIRTSPEAMSALCRTVLISCCSADLSKHRFRGQTQQLLLPLHSCYALNKPFHVVKQRYTPRLYPQVIGGANLYISVLSMDRHSGQVEMAAKLSKQPTPLYLLGVEAHAVWAGLEDAVVDERMRVVIVLVEQATK